METSCREGSAQRRPFLKQLLAFLALGTLRLPLARAEPTTERGRLDEVLEAIVGSGAIRPSADIKLDVPDIAENGAIVPVTVESTLTDVRELLLFVEKNPTPLAAHFHFEKAMEAFASLRIKMNESCDVLAVIRAGDAYYSARKRVKVMVGGCS